MYSVQTPFINLNKHQCLLVNFSNLVMGDDYWRKAKLEIHFLTGLLRWKILQKKCYGGDPLGCRGCNTHSFKWEANILLLSY